jgi:hypothetical protein
MSTNFPTPILFIVFNRPSETREVFNKICQIKPQFLYIVADGPRPHKETDKAKCAEVRSIVSNINWECEVQYLFREENLGCGKSVSNGITWFFSQVEEGIILEDDCVPDSSFFNYCSILLEYYRHDERIMHIGGLNHQNGIKRTEYSYYFSSWVHIWGWASWRRAWEKFEYKIHGTSYKLFLKPEFRKLYQLSFREMLHWWICFERTAELNAWGYQWIYTVLKSGGLAIVPEKNLIKNIGFTEDATHTTTSSALGQMQLSAIEKIRHPPIVELCREADKHTFQFYNSLSRPLYVRAYIRFKKQLGFCH